MIEFLESHMLECLFMKYGGIPCFGCGLQRALILLLQGDLMAAIAIYPPLIPQFSLLAYLGLHLKFQYKKGARNLLWLFGITVSLMIFNLIFKLNT